jgi:predicted RNase H-like nuclease (RuvC/YqgF family)
MVKKNIFLIVIISCILSIAGCGSETKIEPNEVSLETNAQQTAASQEMEQAQEMQLAAIKVQDENVALKAKIEELTKQLKDLQDEFEDYKKKMAEPESWEEKYNKSQADNEELRKLVQYERTLREDLLKRVEKDQETINELKSQIKE